MKFNWQTVRKNGGSECSGNSSIRSSSYVDGGDECIVSTANPTMKSLLTEPTHVYVNSNMYNDPLKLSG